MYLLIVTGLSGAGKSLALRCLEEQGFFCVDNLPSSMLKEFVSLCNNASPAIQKAAVTIDSRESLLSRSSDSITEAFDSLESPYEILFLDARDDVLRKRYNEVRRRHPLGEAGDAATGVKRERVFLQPLRDRANYILDTSDIKPKDFPSLIAKVLPEYENKTFSLLFCSFGYKRGVPVDADFVLDMRFMPNPFYYPEYRSLSGLDTPVQEFISSQPFVPEFFSGLEQMLARLIPLFLEQEKHIIRVCFGCTGGRHRSVAAAEEMAKRFVARGMNVRVYHRDINCEAADIKERFEKQP
ncbi:MAG: RNase adapter RapZ [Eubacteriales bacterium]|nr:RNase adapter RapZ [Eubacteriales bacterium]